MTTTTGGALVARMLAAEGVEVVFGIVDGSYFGLVSSLREHGIRLVSPRHETTAVHMAGAVCPPYEPPRCVHRQQRAGGGQRASGCSRRKRRGQPGASPHQLAAFPDRRARSRWHLPVLRPTWGHSTHDEVERRGDGLRARSGAAAPRLSDLLAGPPGCGAPVCARRCAQRLVRRARAGRPGPRALPACRPPRPGSFVGAAHCRPARGRRASHDPGGQRCRARRRVERAARGGRAAPGACHHELGGTRRDGRAGGRVRTDGVRRADQPGANRVRRCARRRHPLRGDRLVGQAALLAGRGGPAGPPGRHRRADHRAQQADRPRRPG